MIGRSERVAGMDAGVGAQHEARAVGDHLRDVVRQCFFTRGEVRRSRPAARRERTRLRGRANRLDDARRQRLIDERIVVADLGSIAEPDDRRPVRFLLTEERQELVVELLALHGVHEHIDAGAHHRLLVRERRRVRVHLHLVPVRFVDDRGVDLRRHLRIGAAAIVGPDLDALQILRRHLLHGRARGFRRRHLVDGVQRSRSFQQDGIGSAAGRRHAWHEQES